MYETAMLRAGRVRHPGGVSTRPSIIPRQNHKEGSVNRLQRALDALVERIDTPAPIVLVDVMQGNIDRMQSFADQHNLDVRPHVKTHKCVEIGRRQVEAGAVGITAGNVGEAEVFAAAGFDDIFLAYPIWAAGTKKSRIRRLAETAGCGSASTTSRRSRPSPTRWETNRTGCRSWSRSTVAPAVPGRPRLRATSRSPPASAVWCRWASSPIQVGRSGRSPACRAGPGGRAHHRGTQPRRRRGHR